MYDSPKPIPGLDGKAAIVWGGGASMGRATVHQLLVSGCRVALVDIDGALAERTAAEFRAGGFDAIGLTGDVTVEADVEAAADAAVAAIGCTQLSASVVGIANYRSLIDMSLAEWHLDQTRNLLPAFLIGRAVARRLKTASLPGSMAFVASIAALQGAGMHASYGAAKSGLTALVKSMAMEWAELGIRANTVAPGMVHTLRVQTSPEMLALVGRKVPSGRFASVQEIAACLAFVLSDMAGVVNGHTLVADGGWMTMPAIQPSDNPRLDVPADPTA